MADAEKHLRSQNLRGIDHVRVGAICDVVAPAFQPVAKRKFPQKELTRADRKRMIENLRIFSIRTIETSRHVWSPRMPRVGVHGVVVRPAIVRLPRIVAALEEDVRPPPVANDKDDVALPGVCVCAFRKPSETSQVNSAGPIRRYAHFGGRLPSA